MALKRALQEVERQVIDGYVKGLSRAEIQQLNIVPKSVLNTPDIQTIFLVMRGNFINRIYDGITGYWRTDLSGVSALSSADYAQGLQAYFSIGKTDIKNAAKDMIKHGDYALAAETLKWGLEMSPNSADLQDLQKQAYYGLADKYQSYNPFKYIIYSEQVGLDTPQIAAQD